MTLSADSFLNAARVPSKLEPQLFGDWRIDRCTLPVNARLDYIWEKITILKHKKKADMSNIHLMDDDGTVMEVVMEDSPRELRRHLPIWMSAHGRVLITGLGLGCVVRGLLSSPVVDHIDVVEIDADIIRIIGGEFKNNPRVTIHQGDAMKIQFPDKVWHFGWHDLWTDGDRHLQSLHAELIARFRKQVIYQQGAWNFPPIMKKYWSRHYQLLGAPKMRKAA